MPITLDGSTGITAGAYNGIDQADLATALNASGSAPIYACRAWVNFDGTGTVAIRASGNVTSITDNGTGNYTLSFTTAMADTSYSFTAWTRRDAASLANGQVVAYPADTKTTTQLQVRLVFGGTTSNDSTEVDVQVVR